MKLKKSGIDSFLWESLCILQNALLFTEYYLVGGTALSLQIGHRISDDIDLFTNSDLKKEAIFDFAKRNISKDIKIINMEK